MILSFWVLVGLGILGLPADLAKAWATKIRGPCTTP